MPFSSLWLKVNRQDVPTNAIWLAVSVAFCMALTVREHDEPLNLELSMCYVWKN